MAHGLRVWGAAGDLQIDSITNLGRIIGRVNTAGVVGSVTDDGLLTGAPEWQVVPLTSVPFATPSVSISGNNLSWTYPSGGPGTNTPVLIVYWVR